MFLKKIKRKLHKNVFTTLIMVWILISMILLLLYVISAGPPTFSRNSDYYVECNNGEKINLSVLVSTYDRPGIVSDTPKNPLRYGPYHFEYPGPNIITQIICDNTSLLNNESFIGFAYRLSYEESFPYFIYKNKKYSTYGIDVNSPNFKIIVTKRKFYGGDWKYFILYWFILFLIGLSFMYFIRFIVSLINKKMNEKIKIDDTNHKSDKFKRKLSATDIIFIIILIPLLLQTLFLGFRDLRENFWRVQSLFNAPKKEVIKKNMIGGSWKLELVQDRGMTLTSDYYFRKDGKLKISSDDMIPSIPSVEDVTQSPDFNEEEQYSDQWSLVGNNLFVNDKKYIVAFINKSKMILVKENPLKDKKIELVRKENH